MTEEILFGLGAIIILGILAQWLAWRFHLPAILLLLVCGFAAGPISGLLNPDHVFGELLFPLVSISVAIILFEGGLSLRLSELKKGGHVIRNLTTIGVLITGGLSALGLHYIVGFNWQPSILLGAVLVVSGPTVIVPLLRQIRPRGNVGSIAKWEGIINDPIGAIMAVLIFEVIASGGLEEGVSTLIIFGAAKALIFGGLIGVAGAAIIVILLKRYFVPDFLHNSVALMVVVMVYLFSNYIQPESGLLAVTVMGIALANQSYVGIKQIYDFKEDLRVILISSLFIILAARIPLESITPSDPGSWIFLALLILVIRPFMVFVSTLGTNLNIREKLFLSWLAPRGIVAAAVVSVFAIRLSELGYAGFDVLVPLTFQAIIATVAVYGLTGPLVARLLGVTSKSPQGVLFAGAQKWVQDIALVLQNEGFNILLVDSNWTHVMEARARGLKAHYANIVSERVMNELDLDGIGKLLAMTPNDEVNSLATLHFEEIFDKREVYQLTPSSRSSAKRTSDIPKHLRGRYLFDEKATYDYLVNRFSEGALVKKTPITEEFDTESFDSMYGYAALPLFVITEAGRLMVRSTDEENNIKPGMTVISLVDPEVVEDKEAARKMKRKRETG